jgi:hypothetical protein
VSALRNVGLGGRQLESLHLMRKSLGTHDITAKEAKMGKQEDRRIAALAKKNAAKIKPPTADQNEQFDPTLRKRTPEQTPEARRLFKDMKRREF